MIFARKRFGQHFLHDRSVLERIVREIAPQPDDALVEIGPGRGALTELLLGTVAHARLRSRSTATSPPRCARAGGSRGIRRCTTPTRSSSTSRRWRRAAAQRLRVIGNLPYNISTPLLFHLAAAHEHIDDLHVMLQKEVVERIVAAPGSGDYGRLTVMLAPWFEAQHLFDVGPGAFTPAPRVWSAVARLTVRREPAFVDAPGLRAHRFGGVLAAAQDAAQCAARDASTSSAIVAAGIDPGVRPETLSPAEFAKIAAHVPRRR